MKVALGTGKYLRLNSVNQIKRVQIKGLSKVM